MQYIVQLIRIVFIILFHLNCLLFDLLIYNIIQWIDVHVLAQLLHRILENISQVIVLAADLVLLLKSVH